MLWPTHQPAALSSSRGDAGSARNPAPSAARTQCSGTDHAAVACIAFSDSNPDCGSGGRKLSPSDQCVAIRRPESIYLQTYGGAKGETASHNLYTVYPTLSLFFFPYSFRDNPSISLVVIPYPRLEYPKTLKNRRNFNCLVPNALQTIVNRFCFMRLTEPPTSHSVLSVAARTVESERLNEPNASPLAPAPRAPKVALSCDGGW